MKKKALKKALRQEQRVSERMESMLAVVENELEHTQAALGYTQTQLQEVRALLKDEKQKIVLAKVDIRKALDTLHTGGPQGYEGMLRPGRLDNVLNEKQTASDEQLIRELFSESPIKGQEEG